ncbi:MAG: choice-of-anchor tandem repeat GloVer-containing protein [Bacteroidia bacterium]
MKKPLLVLSLICTLASNAQYTDLLDFAGATNGRHPNGSLMQASDGMLYGMTQNGGAISNNGVLFQYNPSTSTYTKKLDFAGTTNGSFPNGSLMQASDGMLYGMTQNGGASNNGVLFQYNPATSTYTKKHDFNGTDGQYPYGSLMQASDGMLYGMTWQGGASSNGVLFQYNPATNTYTDKIDFAGTTNGRRPEGSLMQASDGMLYGMTSEGGASSNGNIFQYNTATNTLTDKFDFNGTNGLSPYGDLMQASDGMLYGMAYQGGVSTNCTGGCGVLFQYNTATNTYTKKLDFGGAGATIDGRYPYGSLMQASDGMLYGMTSQGGVSNYGVLFQYNPATGTYTDKYDFNSTNGGLPQGSLMQGTDGMLYGMTADGGANNLGVLFNFCVNHPSVSVNSPTICVGTTATLTASGTATTYSWSTSATTATIIVNPTVTTPYTVTGTAANTCTNAATAMVTISPANTAPAICEVSTDSTSNYAYNIIYWDKTLYNNVDSFLVYRYDPISNGYLRIGAVSKASFSAFTDTCFSIAGPNGGNPVYGAWQYKLAIKDTCGNTSPLSAYHSTIYVTENLSNFSWTQYIDSGYSSMPTGYSFLRDNYNTGNFQVLANLGHTASSTTDPNYASYPNANWRIDALGFNCNPTLRLAGNNSVDAAKIKAHSNINNNRTTGIKSHNQAGLTIFSYNNAIITNGTIPQGSQLKVFNALGQVVLTTALQNNIETNLPSGIYTMQVINNEGSIIEIKKCALITK